MGGIVLPQNNEQGIDPLEKLNCHEPIYVMGGQPWEVGMFDGKFTSGENGYLKTLPLGGCLAVIVYCKNSTNNKKGAILTHYPSLDYKQHKEKIEELVAEHSEIKEYKTKKAIMFVKKGNLDETSINYIKCILQINIPEIEVKKIEYSPLEIFGEENFLEIILKTEEYKTDLLGVEEPVGKLDFD